jgi:hypothetical protein
MVCCTHHSQPLWMWSLPSWPHHEDTTRCDHQRKQAELSRREQPHPTSRSRRTTATHHRGLFGSSLAMGVLSICTTENDPVKYNLNVNHVSSPLLYATSMQTWRSNYSFVVFCTRWLIPRLALPVSNSERRRTHETSREHSHTNMFPFVNDHIVSRNTSDDVIPNEFQSISIVSVSNIGYARICQCYRRSR